MLSGSSAFGVWRIAELPEVCMGRLEHGGVLEVLGTGFEDVLLFQSCIDLPNSGFVIRDFLFP